MIALVHVVADHDTTISRRLNALNRPASPVAVVTPTGQPRDNTMARDLLFAMGKTFDLARDEVKGNGINRTQYAKAWAAARGLREIVVVNAERLPAKVAAPFIDLADACGVETLWFVEYHPTRNKLDDLLQAHSATEATIDDLVAQWGLDRPVRALRTRRTPVFPTVPDTHALTFRADCRRLLDPAGFDAADAVYRREFHDAAEKMADPTRRQHPDRLYRLLGSRFRDTADPDRFLTIARAVQAAALRAGWNITIDPQKVRTAARNTPRPATTTTADWAVLHRYQRTEPPAIATLRVNGVPNDALAELRINNVADNASRVTYAGVRYPICGPGRVFLDSQIRYLRLTGATDDDWLIDHNWHTRHAVRTRCLDWATSVAEETGFQAGHPRTHATADVPIGTRKWAANTGITIRSIHRPRRNHP